MKKSILAFLIAAFAVSTAFTSCEKGAEESPFPVSLIVGTWEEIDPYLGFGDGSYPDRELIGLDDFGDQESTEDKKTASWTFNENGTGKGHLHSSSSENDFTWKISDRQLIIRYEAELKIAGNDYSYRYYTIEKLTPDELILSYESYSALGIPGFIDKGWRKTELLLKRK